MGNKPSNKIIFLRSLLAEKRFPDTIEQVVDSRNSLPLYEKTSAKPLFIDNKSFVLQDVPGYINLILDQHQKKFLIHTITTQRTYVIELNRYSDANQYMEQHFGSKSRSSLRRYKKRLEECFDIRYEVYQGNIDKKWYNEIFEHLRTLMIRRFKKKKEENYELQHLDEIKADLYPMLLQNRATLYVIYANGEPVSIRINMMKDKLAFYILSAYNPDYDIFRLGKLDMSQNISWFINQGYTTYDLLKGYAYIKEKWADRTYANNLVFVNEASNLWNQLKFFFTLASVRFRHTMIKKLKYIGLDKIIHRIKRRKVNHLDKANYVVLPFKETEAIKTIHKNALINLEENKSLIAPIIELAYKHRSCFDQIQVFLKNGNSKEYYILIEDRYYLLKVS